MREAVMPWSDFRLAPHVHAVEEAEIGRPGSLVVVVLRGAVLLAEARPEVGVVPVEPVALVLLGDLEVGRRVALPRRLREDLPRPAGPRGQRALVSSSNATPQTPRDEQLLAERALVGGGDIEEARHAEARRGGRRARAHARAGGDDLVVRRGERGEVRRGGRGGGGGGRGGGGQDRGGVALEVGTEVVRRLHPWEDLSLLRGRRETRQRVVLEERLRVRGVRVDAAERALLVTPVLVTRAEDVLGQRPDGALVAVDADPAALDRGPLAERRNACDAVEVLRVAAGRRRAAVDRAALEQPPQRVLLQHPPVVLSRLAAASAVRGVVGPLLVVLSAVAPGLDVPDGLCSPAGRAAGLGWIQEEHRVREAEPGLGGDLKRAQSPERRLHLQVNPTVLRHAQFALRPDEHPRLR
mmetsp:Transcript_24191/g.58442  ORF Transcript_24191/g.58442 Transcript_24191/m.58442 type:complete len:411 (+) Transcript_24191:759-1991(+)